MKKAIIIAGQTIAGLLLVDALILMLGIAQVASGDSSAYWSPFWMEQARFVLGFIA